MAKGIIYYCEFRIHYQVIAGRKKTNEVTCNFELPLVLYNESELIVHDSDSIATNLLVKHTFCKYKAIQEGRIVNMKIQILKKIDNLGLTNYDI